MTTSPTVEPLLTAKEVAAWLRIGRGSLRRWVQQGYVPGVYVGVARHVRFDRASVEKWLLSHRTGGESVTSDFGAFLTTEEVALHLHMAVNSVRAWVRSGVLPAYRLGSLIRISQGELLTWLSHNSRGLEPDQAGGGEGGASNGQ